MQDKAANTDMNKKAIWNFYLNHSYADLPLADPEQESKILRYPPAEVLISNWYLKKDLMKVQIDCQDLNQLIELDQDSMRKSDLGLDRFLSVVKSCERLEEELLSIEQLLLHPALIYFSSTAKILTLPFPPGMISAGRGANKLAKPWIFSPLNTEDYESGGLVGLLNWIAKHYSVKAGPVNEFMPMCREKNYRKLALSLSGQKGPPAIKLAAPGPEVSQKERGHPQAGNKIKEEKRDKEEDFTYKGKKKTMKTSTNIKETDKNTPGIQTKAEKSEGFFAGLRSRFSRDFQNPEKTADLVVEDPFFRMACLSEGLPGSKEEKLGQRAFILIDEFLIGRDSDLVDFWIDSQNVSRQHARISRRQGSFFLEDLGSRNSTLLDGKKVNKHREYLLPDKCRLTFADKAYYFEASS